MYGSTGGSKGATGGGVVNLYAEEITTIDGSIIATGGDSFGTGIGASSGGSIWIQSKIFTGRGIIQANGGNGLNYGGGGGGGRLATMFENNTFTGKLEAYGGRSKLSPGGAGTVYLASRDGGFRKLIVDNQNIGKPSSDTIEDFQRDGGRTWLTPSVGSHQVILSHLDIRGLGQLASIRNSTQGNLEWDIGVITGDKTGLLHILANQKLVIKGKEGESKLADLPWGINIYKRGELTLSESFVVDGIMIIVAGRLNGARNLTVANGGKVILR